jgi:hypothetical protein
MSIRTSFFVSALILGVGMTSPAIERTIDEQTARSLVEGALPALGESPKWMNIGPWKYYWAPEFYNFSAYRAGGQGVLVIYYLSVNPWTGDVWDAMACKRITTPEIKKEQDAIWQQSGIPSEARETLSNRPPADCSADTKTGRIRKKK